ncbi:epoxide hydrolase N-terminal domain-containing protein [Novosphingobium sp. JCM 18896]|uniref:epoxide hydrolase N-terminal domain-containing protein n=1 Tax=Novosphingobium sp. JCM 18896 TaxID=2989731 RepID=UPI0039B44E2E
MISMNQPEPFKLEVSDAVLDDLRDRLSKVRWPQAHDGPAWALGTSLPFMKTVRDYWLGHYDWRENEKWINGFSHHRVNRRANGDRDRRAIGDQGLMRAYAVAGWRRA